MQTWTVVRFLHIVGITFFVGGQLMLVLAVTPVARRRVADDLMRSIAMRFGIGSLVALGLIAGTGIAMASHLSLWSSDTLQLKLLVLALVLVLAVFHMLTPRSRAIAYALIGATLGVLWLGVKVTYG
jgi:uncharacterized membrane protein